MYYWVNQGKTYKEEKAGGYLWAPIKNSKGNSFFHWENMTKLKPADIVFNLLKIEIWRRQICSSRILYNTMYQAFLCFYFKLILLFNSSSASVVPFLRCTIL